MKTALDILREARKTLNSLESWTKTTLALAEDGRPVDPISDDACRFCLVGAIYRVSGGWQKAAPLADLVDTLWVRAGCPEPRSSWRAPTLTGFNDSPLTSHEDVLKLLDETIARLESPAC